MYYYNDDFRWKKEGKSGVLACSALKRQYRHILLYGAHPNEDEQLQNSVKLLYLKGSKQLIMSRLRQRTAHFMPTHLLDSQFATLEEPCEDEVYIVLDIENSIDMLVEKVAVQLQTANSVAIGTML